MSNENSNNKKDLCIVVDGIKVGTFGQMKMIAINNNGNQTIILKYFYLMVLLFISVLFIIGILFIK